MPVKQVFPTAGSRPLLVSANDYNEYVCKYVKQVPANKLAIELIVSHYAEHWHIFTPKVNLINIQQEHISEEVLRNGVHKKCFDMPLIGSLYYPFSREIDLPTIESWKQNPKQVKQIVNRQDFLKAALFDLWLANEDRNHNNYNILVSSVNGKRFLNFIDHEKCFNSGGITSENSLCLLTEDETILNTEVLPLLYPKKADLDGDANFVLSRFRDYISSCGEFTNEIMGKLPEEWENEVGEVKFGVNGRIFVGKWVNGVEEAFKEYLNTGYTNFSK